MLLSAEWALWGPDPVRQANWVLAHSRGLFDSKTFADLVERYGIGAPDELPQVTFAWCETDAGSYVVLIIQEETSAIGPMGHPVTSTRVFAVPYGSLAGHTLSYEALLSTFDKIHLPQGTMPVEAEVPTITRITTGEMGRTAMQAAALLLTGRPVCLLQASQLTLIERVRFLDTVASLLPYGMRSRLSASTWVRSTAEHKIRLSFAESSRQDRAWGVPWDGLDRLPAGWERVTTYLARLTQTDELDALVADLAGFTQSLGFRAEDITEAVRLVEGLNPAAPPPSDEAPASVRFPKFRRAGEASRISDLLVEAANALDTNDGQLSPSLMFLLRETAGEQRSENEQARHREFIVARRMLRAYPNMSAELREPFYEALITLAFGVPLALRSINEVGRAAGAMPWELPHESLLHVLGNMELTVGVRLLVDIELTPPNVPYAPAALHALAGGQGRYDDLVRAAAELPPRLPQSQVAFVEIHRALVAPGTRPHPRRRRPEKVRHPDFVPALQRHGYLDRIIAQLFAEDTERQLGLLAELLTAAHGDRLHEADVRIVLEDIDSPSPALLVAVLTMASTRARNSALRFYLRSVLSSAGFIDGTRTRALELLDQIRAF
jgi:hypothetical protein